MIAVLVLFVAAVVAGSVTALVTRRARRADPADLRVTPAAADEAVAHHPALRRLLHRRLDPARASGLALTAAAGVALLGTVALGSVLEMVDRQDGLERFDAGAARFGLRHLTPGTQQFFRVVTRFGSSPVVVALALLVVVVEHRRVPARKVVWFLLAAIGGTVAITNVVKVLVDRARPDVARLVGFNGPSFPSGHTSTAAVAYAAFALVLGRGRRKRVRALLAGGAAAMTIAVASSRVLLGVHWLTDVVAGAALGWAWFAVSSILFGGRVLEFGRPVEELERAEAEADADAPDDRPAGDRSPTAR